MCADGTCSGYWRKERLYCHYKHQKSGVRGILEKGPIEEFHGNALAVRKFPRVFNRMLEHALELVLRDPSQTGHANGRKARLRFGLVQHHTVNVIQDSLACLFFGASRARRQ